VLIDRTESGPPPEEPEPGVQQRSAEVEKRLTRGLGLGPLGAALALLGLDPFGSVAGYAKGMLMFPTTGGNISGTSAAADPEGSEIRARIQTWAGVPEEAGRWYRSQPIAAFGDRTAESLVKSGQAEALRDFLDSIALGGFA